MNSCVTKRRDCVVNTLREERPWGGFKTLAKNCKVTVKVIEIEPYGRLSLQYHQNRMEHWMVVKGECVVTIDDKEFDASEGDEFLINQNIRHRIESKKEKVVVVEVAFGDFDENDIVRLEDIYGRE